MKKILDIIKEFLHKVKDFLTKCIAWIAVDGGLHFLASALLVLFFGVFFHKYWWNAPLLAFAIGLGKEIYDYFHPATHSADWHDLICDILGCLLGTGIYLLYIICW